MHTNELMIYRNMEYGRILQDMTFLMEHAGSDYYNPEDLKNLFFECVNKILELSEQHGLEGNLWHTYLTFLLVNDEMPTAQPARSGERLREVSMTWRCMISRL